MPQSLDASLKSAGLLRPLTVALGIAISFIGCGPRVDRVASNVGVACGTENTTPEDVAGLADGFDLEAGELLVLPGSRVLTGVQVSRPLSLGDTTPPERTVRVIHDALGELPLPVRAGNRPSIDLPAPVALPGGRWGLMWVEALPDPSGRWRRHGFTERWMSEWQGAGWTTPTLMVKASLYVDWIGHTTIDNQPEGAYAMVLYEEPMIDRRIVFGPVSEGLSPFPVPNDFVPFAATFMRDSDALITVVIQGHYRSGSDSDSLQFVALRSDDQGTTWSKPEVVWRTSTLGTNLGLYRDAQNTLHLIWTDGWTRTRHIYRAPSTGWTESTLHNSSSNLLFPGVAGIDRCGRLTLLRESWSADSGGMSIIQLRIDRWTSGSWVVDDGMKDVGAHKLFDSRSTGGVWNVAWTGLGRDSRGKVWLITP
jgi:hypothetical protein